MGLRELLLVLILLVVGYMLFLLWQMRAAGRARDKREVHPPREPAVSPPMQDRVQGKGLVTEPTLGVAERPQASPASAGIAGYMEQSEQSEQSEYPEPPGELPADIFSSTGERPAPLSSSASAAMIPESLAHLEGEQALIREEVDALRGALAALRTELGELRAHVEQETVAVRAVQSASPLYSDAMQMALLGHDSEIISERCGIPRAEAELVVALIKNRDN